MLSAHFLLQSYVGVSEGVNKCPVTMLTSSGIDIFATMSVKIYILYCSMFVYNPHVSSALFAARCGSVGSVYFWLLRVYVSV